MVFMVQILKRVDGSFSKGTSEFTSDKDALIALHVAMSSAMAKDETASIMCMLTDEFGSQKKKEYWAAPVVESETEPEGMIEG